MSIGDLEVAASYTTDRAGDLAAQRDLHPAVQGAARGKEHGVTSHQGIDSGKGCAIVGGRRTGIGRETKHGSRKSTQVLPARVETVGGEVADACARYGRQIAVDRGLRAGPGTGSGSASRTQWVPGQGSIDGMNCRVGIQMRGVT